MILLGDKKQSMSKLHLFNHIFDIICKYNEKLARTTDSE